MSHQKIILSFSHKILDICVAFLKGVCYTREKKKEGKWEVTIEYYPKGVCSKRMNIEVAEGLVKSIEILGGCPGNLMGISSLVEGMPVEEVIRRLEGIRCGFKKTSCPDQLAKALQENRE